MNINFNLNYWGGKTLQVRLEENIKDLDLLVVYEDHGDEFMTVRTKEGKYFTYGYYDNRNGMFINDNFYLTKPELFCKPDEHSALSNEIYFKFHTNRGMLNIKHIVSDLTGVEKYSSKDAAERELKSFLSYLDECYDRNIFYNLKQYNYDKDCLYFVEVNGLDKKYIDMIAKAKFDSKRNGIDGYCGKIEDNNYIHYDSVKLIIYKNKIRTKLVDRVVRVDSWGFDTKEANLNQFK